jgi:hypothetical protein
MDNIVSKRPNTRMSNFSIGSRLLSCIKAYFEDIQTDQFKFMLFAAGSAFALAVVYKVYNHYQNKSNLD